MLPGFDFQCLNHHVGKLLRWYSRPSVDCSDIQDCVLYNLVKSVDTVIETGHHLVEIVEKKIAAMMDSTAPAGQLLVDGYLFSGNRYGAVFRLFNCKYKVILKNQRGAVKDGEQYLIET